MELGTKCQGLALLPLENIDLSSDKFLGIWAFPLLPGDIFELAALPPGSQMPNPHLACGLFMKSTPTAINHCLHSAAVLPWMHTPHLEKAPEF